MLKYQKVATLLRTRISRGDYALSGIPVDEKLAAEAGVSRITMRKAVNMLMQEGLLHRQKNGRLAASANSDQKRPYVAFLSPAYHSATINRYRIATEIAAHDLGLTARSIEYMHWDDPVISDTLERFDGVILLPSTEPVPDFLFEHIQKRETPVAILGYDWSSRGFPSLRFGDSIFIRRILSHLKDLGHKQIDLLNTQPEDDVIQERIAHWRSGLALLGLEGRLLNSPTISYQSPIARSREYVGQLLRNPDFSTTAIICTTEDATIGALRACADCHLAVGRDISIASVVNEALAKELVPSITSLDIVDPGPYFKTALEWILRGGGLWNGTLLLEPDDVPLFIGESTGPCPVHV